MTKLIPQTASKHPVGCVLHFKGHKDWGKNLWPKLNVSWTSSEWFVYQLHKRKRGNAVRSGSRRDFPHHLVVKNSPPNSGDTSSIPGLRSKVPRTPGQLNLQVATREVLYAATTKPSKSAASKKEELGSRSLLSLDAALFGWTPLHPLVLPYSHHPKYTCVYIHTRIRIQPSALILHVQTPFQCQFQPPLKWPLKTQLSRKGSSSHMSQLGKGENCQPQRHKCQARSRATSKEKTSETKMDPANSCISEEGNPSAPV